MVRVTLPPSHWIPGSITERNEAKDSLPSRLEVKNECSCTCTSPTYLHDVAQGPFYFGLYLYTRCIQSVQEGSENVVGGNKLSATLAV